MAARQTITRPRVVESVGVLPRDLGVTFLAAAACELVDVRVVEPVTCETVLCETQQGSIERSVLLLEETNVTGGDEIGQMAISTGDFGMFRGQFETGASVIEARRVQVDDCHVASAVLGMTTATGSLANCRVIALSLSQPIPQRVMTLQTLAVGSARLLQFVAAGTPEETFQVFVRRGELSRRDELTASLFQRDKHR
jgi:hypothetical protein